MRPVYLKRLLHSSLLYPSTASHRLQTRYICSAMAQTPIQTLQAAWKRIAPLELADNSWDNVSRDLSIPVRVYGSHDHLCARIGRNHDRYVAHVRLKASFRD